MWFPLSPDWEEIEESQKSPKIHSSSPSHNPSAHPQNSYRTWMNSINLKLLIFQIYIAALVRHGAAPALYYGIWYESLNILFANLNIQFSEPESGGERETFVRKTWIKKFESCSVLTKLFPLQPSFIFVTSIRKACCELLRKLQFVRILWHCFANRAKKNLQSIEDV